MRVAPTWIESEYESGAAIPLPSYPEEHSGRFNVRLPRSLHRELAESAQREGVSLNQYVVMLLSRRDLESQVASCLEWLEGERPGADEPRERPSRGPGPSHRSVARLPPCRRCGIFVPSG